MNSNIAGGWSLPAAPILAAPAQYSTVEHASLTTFTVAQVDDRRRATTGAVYDAAGMLISASQRTGGIGGDLVTAVDPESISGAGGFNRLTGRWLYGGNWMSQFGHFISESLTTLWPRLDVDGIICHPFIFGTSVHPWQMTLVRRLGFTGPVLIAKQGCIVDELVIPQRPFTLNKSAAPEAVNVWNRVASPGTHGGRVFLSRSKLEKDPRHVPGDDRLDDMMTAKGFQVIHPQTLSVDEQLEVVAGTSIVSGVSGSALHLSAFAHPHCKVLELGDARSPRAALPNQRVIDNAVGRQSGFIPFVDDEGRRALAKTSQLLDGILPD